MTQFEYYSHNKMRQVKNDFTPALINELKSFLVERVVDNMSTEDLVQYVTVSYTHLTLPTNREV